MTSLYARTIRSLTRLCLIALVAFAALQGSAFASAPLLNPSATNSYPKAIKSGDPLFFQFTYISDAGDAPDPKKTLMYVDGKPYEAQHIDNGDPKTGVEITWLYTPQEAGDYHYHFVAVSKTGQQAVYPTDGSDLDVDVVNLSLKVITLVVWLVLALGVIPFVVYIATRSVNRRGDPSATARVALLIGIVISYVAFLYLFLPLYTSFFVPILVGIAAVALLIVLFTRRK